MKYRFAALLVVLALIFSSFGFASATPTPAQEAADAAIAYLEEAAYAQYYHREHTLEERTIASLPETDAQILSQVSADYATFRNAQPVLPYEEASIDTGSMEALRDNLSLHWDSVAYYGFLNQRQNITYDYLTLTYDVVSCTVDGNLAAVELYETVDFQYSFCDEPSMMMTHFYLSLMEHDGSWMIMAVESDSYFHQAYRETGFDLQREIAGVLEADRLNAQREQLTADASVEVFAEPDDVVEPMYNGLNRPYNRDAASKYALMYTTQSQDDDFETPIYKNDKFCWNDASCMLFVSQCVWAGFGGSDDQASINSKYGMDSTGTYWWWSTKITTSTVSSQNGYHSWLSCRGFREYLQGVRTNSTESGIVSTQYTTVTGSDSLVGNSGITVSQLKGAALLVDGDAGAFTHAIVVNAANGENRDEVYYCGYNPCAKNIRLEDKFPSSTSSDSRIMVLVPTSLRNGDGATADYLSATPQTATVMGSNGTSLTLTGTSTVAVSALTMEVYAPNALAPTHTFTRNNGMTVSASVLFNQVGTWKVVISAPGMRSYTQLIRVVSG